MLEMIWNIVLIPFRVVGGLLSGAFGLIRGLVGLVVGLLGGVLSIALGVVLLALLGAAVYGLCKGFKRT